MKLLSIHLKSSQQFWSSAPETFQQICRFIYQTWKSMGNKPLQLLLTFLSYFWNRKVLLSLKPNEARGGREERPPCWGQPTAAAVRHGAALKRGFLLGVTGKTACWALCSALQRPVDGFMLWRMIRYHFCSEMGLDVVDLHGLHVFFPFISDRY